MFRRSGAQRVDALDQVTNAIAHHRGNSPTLNDAHCSPVTCWRPHCESNTPSKPDNCPSTSTGPLTYHPLASAFAALRTETIPSLAGDPNWLRSDTSHSSGFFQYGLGSSVTDAANRSSAPARQRSAATRSFTRNINRHATSRDIVSDSSAYRADNIPQRPPQANPDFQEAKSGLQKQKEDIGRPEFSGFFQSPPWRPWRPLRPWRKRIRQPQSPARPALGPSRRIHHFRPTKRNSERTS